jgi:uncharacterized membrane protein YhfC
VNHKRFLAAVAAIFVFAMIWNGFVHLVILEEPNRALDAFARAPADRSIAVGLLLTIGLAACFVWTYVRWSPSRSLSDGLIHGVVFAALAGLLVDLNQYLIYPLPGFLAARWFFFGTMEFLIYGLITSAVFKGTARKVRSTSIGLDEEDESPSPG